ncbi:hypothetical protein BGZ97_002931 [Linnemannia gamsii]|uniref:Uncharacterized protein n=1 Tax=Linnemannia gamsii TaxID=64522 RepID=A0A9P6USL0_9FUNG|nr:hypothetical protein BGZ97_002931 [Linnemannia gamsii]
MNTPRSRRAIAFLSIGVLFFLNPVFVSAQSDDNRPHHELERLVALSSNHAAYDSDDFSSPELAATAVSPFCKSFTFLCHVRCLQRGDAKDPTNTSQTGSKGEISRCSHVPNTNKNRVLCLCNNGVDLTAEVDYALEGVVDIQAAGGDGVGTGEAGKIREVVYGATTVATKVVTATETVTSTVTSVAPAPPPTTITETVTVFADSLGTTPTAKPAPTPPPVQADTPDNGNANAPRPDDGNSDRGKPEEQDEGDSDDENAAPIRSESATWIGAHHGFAKVKNMSAQDLKNKVTQPQFGVVAQELGQTGELANDPDAYQDPYLEQELAGMFDSGEMQAYADEAEVEAEKDDQRPNIGEDKDEEYYEDENDYYDSNEDAYQDEYESGELKDANEEGEGMFSATLAEDQDDEDEEDSIESASSGRENQ